MRRLCIVCLLGALVPLGVGLAVADDNTITITSHPVLTAQIGQLYEYQVVAVSDPPGVIITYSLHEGPDSMTINSQTGLIRWMPMHTGSFRVEVRARGDHDSPTDDGGEAEQEYTLRVLSGSPSTVMGSVRNQQGLGVADVHVRMFEISSSHFLFGAITDSMGGYSIAGVNPGTYFLRASPPPNSIYAEQWFDGVRRIQDATPVVVPESTTVTTNFVLFPRDSTMLFLLAGNVSDTSGHPLVHAKVSIFRSRRHDDHDGSGFNFEGLDDGDRDQHVVRVVFTDSMGNYSARLQSRRYILSARAQGFVTQFWDHKSNPLDADRLNLVSDTSGIDFNLNPLHMASGVISGQVTSRTTLLPLAAHVLGFQRLTEHGNFTGFIRHTDTDSLGMYSLRDLRNGFYVVLAVPEGDYLPTFYDTTGGTTHFSLAFPVPVNDNTTNNINILALPDTVSGMDRVQGIVSSGGVGLPGAILYAYSAATNDVAGASISEANGAYRLVGLAPGSYLIGGEKPGYESSLSPVLQLQYNGNMPATSTQNIVLVNSLTGAGGATGNLPGTFTLQQNYPNPFNPSTRIEYSLSAPGRVSLKVFNLLGQEVATLVNDLQDAGVYRMTFDAARFASGVYIYRLQVGALTEARKMVIIK